MKMMKKALVMGMTGAMAAGLAFTASAQDNANTEVNTAHAHALMAQNANTVAMAHTHLQHVINCLVGANGTGFDAAAGTPCKGQGNGAIPDAASNHALHGKLESALADAQAGLKASDLKAVQAKAGKAATALQATPAKKAGGGDSW